MKTRQSNKGAAKDIRRMSESSVRSLQARIAKAKDTSLRHKHNLSSSVQREQQLTERIESNRSEEMKRIVQEIDRIKTSSDSRMTIFGFQTKQLSYSASESIRTLQRRLSMVGRRTYNEELHMLRLEISKSRRFIEQSETRIVALTKALVIASQREELANARRDAEKERKRVAAVKNRETKSALRKQLVQKSAMLQQHTDKVRKQTRHYRSALQSDLCIYCCKAITDGGHLDHIYPVSRGGKSVDFNLVMVCARCNQAKSDQSLYEFCSLMNFDYLSVVQRLIATGKKP